MAHRARIRTSLAIVAGLCLGGAAFAAAPLHKLPRDSALPQAENSPGVVVFRHTTHVQPKAPDCTSCHPRMWPMRPGRKKPEIKHKAMKKGEYCGKCHESTKAFGLDECERCHASE